MRGQLSAEMMILIVVVLAIVAIAATQLIGNAKDAGEQIDTQTKAMYDKTSEAMKGGVGDWCPEDGDDEDDCQTGLHCEDHKCTE